MTRLTLDLQRAASDPGPADDNLERWVLAALPDDARAVELCIRIVGEHESAALNRRYRGKAGATNVLSFPCDAQLQGPRLLGDLVICAPVVSEQASSQHKPEPAHWAHMVVHGVLHLLGYDHIGDHEAAAMESAERDILSRLGFTDPYSPEKYSEGAQKH